MMVADLVARGRGSDSTGPGRNGAVGIAGHLAAERGEVFAEAGRFGFRDCTVGLMQQREAGEAEG
jgi:hypothetical protein